MIVAIRGAITVDLNDREQILAATKQMIREVMTRNKLAEDNLISMIFTVTQDLNQAFPAEAARSLGLTNTPLMCTVEIPVPGSLPKCIRVLVHCHCNLNKDQVRHVYLRQAVNLRRDLVKDDLR
ncbi:MAG: chorismate mutase [Firmicutes bacterium]|nr:chorismate mutase [Bacillota bacterium]